MNNPQILIIDDEAQIRKLLQITLESNEFQVRLASTAKEGLAFASSYLPDLIILDLGLPDENGHEVLKKLREWYSKAIIILSVESNEESIIRALDHGANDYLIKPFRTGELLARIRSAIRSNTIEDNVSLLTFDTITIDLVSRIVKKANELIKLTTTEYALIVLFARHEGKVLTHQYLLKEVWGPTHLNDSQYLRVYIAQLRKKIEDDPNRPVYIITESGVGYRFIGKL